MRPVASVNSGVSLVIFNYDRDKFNEVRYIRSLAGARVFAREHQRERARALPPGFCLQ